MPWYLYIVQATDNSLYTGITIDINRRIKQHNDGTGAKYLLGKTPVKLLYKEQFNSRSEASRRESEIKSWKREKKLELLSK